MSQGLPWPRIAQRRARAPGWQDAPKRCSPWNVGVKGQGLGYRVKGLGAGVRGLRFRVRGFESRVLGLRLRG